MELFTLFTDTEEGKHKRARLLGLQAAVTPILANNLQTEFTDHSVKHSNNVCLLIDRLAEPLREGGKRLTDREAFVLYAAAYLHDIGMQYENAGWTGVIEEAELAPTWEMLTREKRGSHLRSLHNRISAELVMHSRNSATPPIGFKLDDSDDPGLIASLCEGHILDVESARYAELMDSSGSPIRLRLLSGLLRMADILDESQERANRPKADSLLLPVLSQAHWFRHYYTKEVSFDAAGKTINLRFVLPKKRRDEYSNIVPALSVPEIESELRRHDGVFAYSGVRWVIKHQVDTNPYSDADEMPHEVEAEMLSMLQERAKREANGRREAMLGEFEQAQPVIERMLAEIEQLPPETPPLEKARRFMIAAERLRKIEATHSEVGLLQDAYRLYGMAQEVTEQFNVGLRLIDLYFNEGLERTACNLALDCERIIANANIPASERLQLKILKARGLGAVCAYSEACAAYREAINLAQNSTPMLAYDLGVELGELQLLVGEMEAANDTLLPLVSSEQENNPHARSRAVAALAYLIAYRGNMVEALRTLEAALVSIGTITEHALPYTLLINAKTSLLYLDCRADEADATLLGIPKEVTLRARPTHRLVVENNRKICQLVASPFEGIRRNDMYRDAQRLTGQPNDEVVAWLEALQYQRSGNHTDALPRFWTELQRAYSSGNWQRYWFAEELLADECLQIGQPAAAAYHAILGLSDAKVQQAAIDLLADRNQESIRETIERTIASKLSMHFIGAAKLLEYLADAAPEDTLQMVVPFLLHHARTPFIIQTTADTVRPAWRALKAFAFRLDHSLAKKVLGHIGELDLTQVNEFVLTEIVETLTFLIGRLQPEDLPDAAAVVLPLVDGYDPSAPHRIHYTCAINAACNIAHFASEELKRAIGNRLFPPGVPQYDGVKMQILPYFKDLTSGEWADNLASQAIDAVRSQVREEEASSSSFVTPSPGSSMAHVEDIGNGRRRVISVGADIFLNAALAHLERIEPEMVQALLQACLDLALLEENQPNNRIVLIWEIPRIAAFVPSEKHEAIFNTVLKLANGEKIRQKDKDRVDRTNNPLNPIKIQMGSPIDIRGSALCCLARLLTCPEVVWSLLEAAIVSQDAKLRLWATIATEFLPQVNDSLFTALVFGLRDPTVEVAIRSYSSLVSKQELSLDSFKVGLIMTALRLATLDGNVDIRRSACALGKRMRIWTKDDVHSVTQIEEVLNIFAGDICYSVREAGAEGSQPDVKSEGATL